MINEFLNFFLNLDKNLAVIIVNYGAASYFILFFIIFFETGAVIAPFLPGDSLLFAAGTLASIGLLNIFLLFLLLASASILGDSVNYLIGRFLGLKISNSKYIKREYLEKTKNFYKKHGGKTIILARFIPIIRTFAPFVAGIGKMQYPRFLLYNVLGGTLWVALFLFAGFFFGNIPLIKNNFSLVIIAIVLISVIPILIEIIKEKSKK